MLKRRLLSFTAAQYFTELLMTTEGHLSTSDFSMIFSIKIFCLGEKRQYIFFMGVYIIDI